jgi:hypothetical protein
MCLVNLLITQGWKLICLSGFSAFAFLLASCFSDTRMGSASVWREGRDICFAPNVKGRELPELQAIEVYDISSSHDLLVWFFYFPGEANHLVDESCLAYGVLPVGAIGKGKADELVAGRAYEVYINAKYPDPYNPVFGFSRKFCLKGSQADITLINYDKENGWDLSQCK